MTNVSPDQLELPFLPPDLEAKVPHVLEAARRLEGSELPGIIPLAAEIDPNYDQTALSVGRRVLGFVTGKRETYLRQRGMDYLSQEGAKLVMAALTGRGELKASPLCYESVESTDDSRYGSQPHQDYKYYQPAWQ